MRPEKIVSINTVDNPAEAFDRVMRGVDLLANAVKLTLGPYGRNFIVEKSGKTITNDGVSIAREVQSRDEIEELGVRAVREAALKTNDDAGDGTTTATVIAQAILKECSRFLARKNQFAKRSVLSLKNQIEKECAEVVEMLKAQAVAVTTKEDLISVARVAVEDEQLADIIGSAQYELGPDGYVVPEEHAEPIIMIERINGIRIDNGLGTSMVMNDKERQRLFVENVPVILTNYQIQTIGQIKNILDQLVKRGERHIVVVARAYSGTAIRECMENHARNIMIYPFQAPYVNQREIMKDMQAVLGGRYIHDEDSELESMRLEDVGKASQVIGYRYSAIFTGTKDVNERVEVLKKEYEGEPSKFQKEAIKRRIAQLENGFSLLKIGSLSDITRKYLYDKAEDAVNAVRSAYQEGTVKGGGLAMKEISDSLPDDYLLKRPLLAPYEQIQQNAGEEFGIEDWVRNSLKVERCALQNACSAASDLITIGGAIAPEKMKPIDTILNAKTNQEEGENNA